MYIFAEQLDQHLHQHLIISDLYNYKQLGWGPPYPQPPTGILLPAETSPQLILDCLLRSAAVCRVTVSQGFIITPEKNKTHNGNPINNSQVSFSSGLLICEMH